MCVYVVELIIRRIRRNKIMKNEKNHKHYISNPRVEMYHTIRHMHKEHILKVRIENELGVITIS